MSMFFGNSILRRTSILMDKANGDGGSGGGGSGTPPPAAPDSAKELADLKASNAALLARLDALEGKGKNDPPPPKDEGDLGDKARKEREAKDKAAGDTKKLATALKFTMGAAEWLKTNSSLLPKSVEGIFAQAEKENYENDIEKADAIKVGIVSEFFSQQVNLDLLTVSQKEALDDWKKLTKTDKQARVHQVFDNVFEPTFESLKRIKKAEALRDGAIDQTDEDAAYSKKMMELSRKHYLGV